MAKTASAKADALAEGTDPVFVVVTRCEVFLIVSLEAEGAKFAGATVIIISVDLKFTRIDMSKPTLFLLLFTT